MARKSQARILINPCHVSNATYLRNADSLVFVSLKNRTNRQATVEQHRAQVSPVQENRLVVVAGMHLRCRCGNFTLRLKRVLGILVDGLYVARGVHGRRIPVPMAPILTPSGNLHPIVLVVIAVLDNTTPVNDVAVIPWKMNDGMYVGIV